MHILSVRPSTNLWSPKRIVNSQNCVVGQVRLSQHLKNTSKSKISKSGLNTKFENLTNFDFVAIL